MKTLYLLRHAKTEPERHDLPDYKRRLTERGVADARAVGKWVKNDLPPDIVAPQFVISSSAARAAETTAHFMSALSPESLIADFQKPLYHAPPDVLLGALLQVDDAIGSVMLVAHNPGIGELARVLPAPHSAFDLVDYPTARLSVFTFAVESWHDVRPGRGKVAAVFTPSA